MSNTTHEVAHPERVNTEVLKGQALELRISGATYQQIARTLHISASTAHAYVTSGLEEVRERSKDLAAAVRDVDMVRLDAMLLKLWPSRDKPRTADTILRILERRAKLTGADAPTRWEGSGPGGGPIPFAGEINLGLLSTERLRQLEEIVGEASLLDSGNQEAAQLPSGTPVSKNGGGEQNGGGIEPLERLVASLAAPLLEQ